MSSQKNMNECICEWEHWSMNNMSVKKYKSFEDYLREQHAREYSGTDDNMPDAFERWLGDIEPQDFIDLGDSYGKEII